MRFRRRPLGRAMIERGTPGTSSSADDFGCAIFALLHFVFFIDCRARRTNIPGGRPRRAPNESCYRWPGGSSEELAPDRDRPGLLPVTMERCHEERPGDVR